jgi:hypothetical protein
MAIAFVKTRTERTSVWRLTRKSLSSLKRKKIVKEKVEMKKILYVFIILMTAGLGWAGPVDDSIDIILKDYFKIQSALAQDSTDGVDAAAQSINETAESINAGDSEEVKALVSEIRSAAREIQGKDLETTRSEFFNLSKPLLAYLNTYHSHKDAYYRYFCPMAKKGWVQEEEGTKNPYYGSSMLTCGQLIE